MAQNAAAALDAADGRMDGRFFGRPIVQGGPGPRPPPHGMPPQGMPQMGGMPQQSGAAAALDAADGKMDGRFFGRPIVQQGAPPPGALVPYSGAPPPQAAPVGYGYGAPAMPMPTMGFGGGFGAVPAAAYSPATFFGGNTLSGGMYGAPVYNNFNTMGSFGTAFNPGMYGSGFNTIGSGVPVYGGMVNSGIIGNTAFGGFGGFGGYGGAVAPAMSYGAFAPQVYGGGGFVGASPAVYGARPAAVTPVGGANTMAGRMALDAADGVMDGNYFGSRIV